MVITLTKSAVNKLETMKWKEDQSPRIDANIAGGCGMSIKFTLVFEEPRRNDTFIENGDIQIRIDRFTKRYLNEETQIDYTEEHGFLVGESFASSACSIEVD
ncbi:iron-sulfur cluster biosynthesis family protein [Peribacillus simplex]|uniref:iron-sulfur cluster biosynthesis family protein n=1 Tax=Peribacillus TaxID=2675229 RepID=UPI001921FA45|nr:MULTISPECIES: iron-sulfur cluster biosynthesis family protein [Peribacillus]MBD8588046.1 iron-sulfur cluster biosynthesis family protein [Peribacillus simplex]MEA3575295.1 iron-sulfur cluster biosynthesis family protein [Peribacillus frigoritolerans]